MSICARVVFCACIAVSVCNVHGQDFYYHAPQAQTALSPKLRTYSHVPLRLPAVETTAADSTDFSAAAAPEPSHFESAIAGQALQPIMLASHVVSANGRGGGDCTAAIDTCCNSCCEPVWAHRSGMFGEYLFLRARNASVAYAVPIDGSIAAPISPPPVQRGPIAAADPGFDSGYRVGGTHAFDFESSVTLAYMRFDSSTFDVVSTSAPLALRALVLHPQTTNAATNFLDATGELDIAFQLVDVDYRAAFLSNSCSVLNYQVGLRYAQIEQDFAGVFTNAGTTELLTTGTDFEGLGLRLGLDGERHLGHHGLFVYGRGTANLLAGEVSGIYVQSTSPAAPEVDTSWREGRMITILELEFGGGWQSRCGRYRLSGGYQFNSWQDIVTVDHFVEGVQSNAFAEMSDSLTFDGLNAKFEYRW